MANQTKTTDHAWAVDHAKRSIEMISDDAKATIRRKIAYIRDCLDEAEQRLDRDAMPNTCGILQSSALELEMALARYAAIHDASPAIKILTNIIDSLAPEPESGGGGEEARPEHDQPRERPLAD